MGLKQFIKGTTDPKDQTPGCANYDSHYGGCLYADTCMVEQGKRCSFFERSVLPTASQLKDGHWIIDEYQRTVGSNRPLGITLTKVNFCECGATIPIGRRYCDTCKRRQRAKTKREYQKKFRMSKRSTVEQKQAL
jgi:hypothetical protein